MARRTVGPALFQGGVSENVLVPSHSHRRATPATVRLSALDIALRTSHLVYRDVLPIGMAK